jgi:hypothetical protein
MSKIISIHVPAELKNLIINGNLDFFQRVVGNTTTVNTATTTAAYDSDMIAHASQGATVKNYSVVRSTDVPSLAQSGFQSTYSSLFTMITAIASPAAGDLVQPIRYRMEGFDYERIHTKKVTIGFWIKASVAGTYSLSLLNAALNRSYVTTFTASNSWEFKTITVQLDSSGTWAFDNTVGLEINIGAVAGTTFSTAASTSWQGGQFYAATGATNWQATAGATLRIAQLSLVEGSLGLGSVGFQRAGKDIQQELAMCQRYIEVISGATGAALGSAFTTSTTAASAGGIYFAVVKRTTPNTTTSGSPFKYSNATNNYTATTLSVSLSSPTGISFSLTGLSPATAGANIPGVCDATGTAVIYFDAGL